MINLLPTDIKQDLMFARRNTVLARWVGVLLAAILGIGVMVMGGTFYMSQAINNYSAQLVKDRESLQVQKLDETQARLQDISSSVKLVIQVLSREVLFSKLLRQLGAIIPPNTVLLQLQIDKVQGGLSLRAGAVNIEAATQLQLNLQDPTNKIFEKADIENINCTEPDPAVKYSCTIQLKVLFTKDNPFLFINKSAQARGSQ